MSISRAFICLFLTSASLLTSHAQADFLVELTSGHADIGLARESNGSLFLHYHFGVGSAVLNGSTLAPGEPDEYAPSEAFIRVADSERQFPGAVPFLSTGPSDPVWVLPQTLPPVVPPALPRPVPYMGLAAEELDTLDFVSAGFRLTGFSGPVGGQFALWQNDSFGNSNVLFQTNNGINPAVDLYSIGIGSHNHANWGFTKEGIYNLTIEGFADLRSGGQLTDTGTFTFAVGSATAVPEPSSIALIAVCSAGLFAARRRFSLSNDTPVVL